MQTNPKKSSRVVVVAELIVVGEGELDLGEGETLKGEEGEEPMEGMGDESEEGGRVEGLVPMEEGKSLGEVEVEIALEVEEGRVEEGREGDGSEEVGEEGREELGREGEGAV